MHVVRFLPVSTLVILRAFTEWSGCAIRLPVGAELYLYNNTLVFVSIYLQDSPSKPQQVGLYIYI